MHCKKLTQSLTTVHFANGTILCGTGKHQVFTWDSGFVRLDALSLTNEIESDNAWRRLLWLCLEKLCTPVKPFGFKAHVDTISQAGRMRRRDFFIDASIQTIMVRFLQDTLSIIAMVIGQIIGLKTSKVSQHKTTCDTIQPNAGKTLNTVHKGWRIWRRHKNLLASGISPRKASPGMQNMESIRGTRGNLLRSCVQSAGKSVRAIFQHAHDFVPVRASNGKAISGIKPLLAHVCCVAKRLCITNIGSSGVVPVSVATVSALDTVPVYNLTLDGDNVYYANGVLVANCGDALSLTFAVRVAPKSMPKAPAFRVPQGRDAWMA
jgi:hypothetical protein